MFDRPITALKDEEEMEDFHDYDDDEEHAEMDSKLDDYEDDEEDDDEEIALPPVVEPMPAAIAEPSARPGPPAEAMPGTPAKKPVKQASSSRKAPAADRCERWRRPRSSGRCTSRA